VQIANGATILHIMTDDGPQSFALSAGMVVIVPQNTWHRFEAPDGVGLMTATRSRPSISPSGSTIRAPSTRRGDLETTRCPAFPDPRPGESRDPHFSV
jgi:hypothetical protein